MAFCLLTLEALIKTNRAIAYTESITANGKVPRALIDAPDDWEPSATAVRGRIFAYLDDITGVVRPGWTQIVYKYVEAQLAHRHIKFNKDKTEMINGQSRPDEAIKVLGIPVYYADSTAFRTPAGALNVTGKAFKIIDDQYNKKVGPWVANMLYDEWKKYPNEGITILGMCGSGRLNYWARNLDPMLFQPFAAKFDEAMVTASKRMMGIQWHGYMNTCITLPARMGGMGLTSMVDTATYAPGCAGKPGAQHKKKLEFDKTKRKRLLDDLMASAKQFGNGPLDPLCDALYHRLTQPHSAHYTLSAMLPAHVFTVAMAHRFASTVARVPNGAVCACCSQSLDIDHHLKCTDPKVNFVLRHSDVLRVVATYATTLGHEVDTEVKTGVVLNTGEKRFDHVISLQHNRSKIATDVKVTYLSTLDAERQKQKHYADVLATDAWKDTPFYPLVATASGDITDTFAEFLLNITLHRKNVELEEWRNVTQTAAYIRSARIGIARAIAEANYDLFSKCVGAAKPPGWA
jgi:hypothetical protein